MVRQSQPVPGRTLTVVILDRLEQRRRLAVVRDGLFVGAGLGVQPAERVVRRCQPVGLPGSAVRREARGGVTEPVVEPPLPGPQHGEAVVGLTPTGSPRRPAGRCPRRGAGGSRRHRGGPVGCRRGRSAEARRLPCPRGPGGGRRRTRPAGRTEFGRLCRAPVRASARPPGFPAGQSSPRPAVRCAAEHAAWTWISRSPVAWKIYPDSGGAGTSARPPGSRTCVAAGRGPAGSRGAGIRT